MQHFCTLMAGLTAASPGPVLQVQHKLSDGDTTGQRCPRTELGISPETAPKGPLSKELYFFLQKRSPNMSGRIGGCFPGSGLLQPFWTSCCRVRNWQTEGEQLSSVPYYSDFSCISSLGNTFQLSNSLVAGNSSLAVQVILMNTLN